jgi:GTP-binding protein
MNRVLIVGRPNVGKSTLFNRIVKKRKSIVLDMPGTTRDVIEMPAEWGGKEFLLVDTGGLITGEEEDILRLVRESIERELPKADVILFVVDAKALTPLDSEIAKLLYSFKDKILLVVNKIDTPQDEDRIYEFYSLGFEHVFPLSAQHGKGTGELLDEVIKRLGEESIPKEEALKLSFVGRPNVGKSSLVNALLGQERVIVSPQAGTTRDAVEIPFKFEGKKFILVDTAGVRRPARVNYGVEFFSVGRTLEAIDESDVVCLVLDMGEGITRQDKRLGGLIERRYKGCVIVANKVDLCGMPDGRLEEYIRKELFFLDYAPIVKTVATEGKGVLDIIRKVELVRKDYTKKFKTSFINRVVDKILQEKRPPSDKRGKEVKVYYAFQEKEKPPTIIVITNYPDSWQDSYVRFFKKRLKELLGLKHSPIKLIIKGRDA